MRAVLAAVLVALAATAAVAAPKERGPNWAALTADQQQALAPLAAEWNKLSLPHKTKWLGIAKRYPAMKPEEQKRAQGRMQKWAKLTPEQRWQAREQYRSLAKIAPDRRDELRRHWAEYQALPPHEKRMFDVPPNYVPPAERRHRADPAKPKSRPHQSFVLPAPL
jgi:Spy/CpxP family protein refolding chaperone